MGFKVSLNTSAITTNHEVFGSLRLRGCCLCPTCHLPQRCCGSRQDPWGPSCRSCSLCRQRCLRLCPRILQRILRRCLERSLPLQLRLCWISLLQWLLCRRFGCPPQRCRRPC